MLRDDAAPFAVPPKTNSPLYKHFPFKNKLIWQLARAAVAVGRLTISRVRRKKRIQGLSHKFSPKFLFARLPIARKCIKERAKFFWLGTRWGTLGLGGQGEIRNDISR